VGRRFGATALLIACGGHRTEAEEPVAAAPIIPPPPEYEMNKMPVPASAEPKSDQQAPSASAPEPPPKKLKEMQPLFSNDNGVTTIVGTHGAVFKVGGATLRIPIDALREAKDIHFATSKTTAAKGEPARLGGAFEIGPALTSIGPPFELTLPIPADAPEVALVVIMRAKEKDGKAKATVATLAPKGVDSKKHEALFELAELPEGTAYLAQKPPSSPQASAAPSSSGPSGP
jgi:hypothetical protein